MFNKYELMLMIVGSVMAGVVFSDTYSLSGVEFAMAIAVVFSTLVTMSMAVKGVVAICESFRA